MSLTTDPPQPPVSRFQATLVGAAFALFAAGALATALMLDGPTAGDSPYLLATAPALVAAKPAPPAPACANCGIVEAVTTLQRDAATLYDVTVRMTDGTQRHLALTQPLPLGRRLHLDGGRITVLPAQDS